MIFSRWWRPWIPRVCSLTIFSPDVPVFGNQWIARIVRAGGPPPMLRICRFGCSAASTGTSLLAGLEAGCQVRSFSALAPAPPTQLAMKGKQDLTGTCSRSKRRDEIDAGICGCHLLESDIAHSLLLYSRPKLCSNLCCQFLK